jgi:hypothetical protein
MPTQAALEAGTGRGVVRCEGIQPEVLRAALAAEEQHVNALSIELDGLTV